MNLTSQSTLSRLLAKENITVQHGNYSTAFFDVKSRVLGLPMWKDVSKDVYDLLCGHEVGHALFTPANGLDPQNMRGARQDYVNVVEDVRIEKMIQSQYPGLISCFKRGYAAMHAKDFFGLRGRSANELNFPDRLNLKFKMRDLVDIDFSVAEMRIFNLIESAQTWDEVVSAAIELQKFVNESAQPQPQPQKNAAQQFQAQSGDEQMDPTPSQSDNSEQNNSDESGESDETSQNSGDKSDDDSGESSDSLSNSDSDAAGEADTSKNDEDSKPSKSQKTDDLSQPTGNDANGQIDPRKHADPSKPSDTSHGVQTQRSFDESAKNLIDRSKGTLSTAFAAAPTPKECLENIMPYAELAERRNCAVNFTAARDNPHYQAEFQSFIKSQRKVIAMMAKEFELRKAAYQYTRATVSRTGSLNMEKLPSYRVSDDLFLSVSKLADAKNHGMVMFVDYSGSMTRALSDVLKHVINLALFCRQVSIPFNVYAFTGDATGRTKSVPYSAAPDQYTQDKVLVSNTVLFDLINSDLNKADFNSALYALWLRAKNDYFRSPAESLGNTPLNETLIIAHEILKQFRAKHNPDKLTAIFLTDGEGHALRISNAVNLNPIRTLSEKDIGWGQQYASFKLNGRQIRALTWGHAANGEQAMTPTLIENLRITTGAEIIGFYLCDNKNRLRNHAVIALGYTKHAKNALNAWTTIFEKQYSENDVICIPDAFNYSNYFILAGSDLEIETEELDVTPDMTRGRIARAFKNFSANKKGNRIFVTKFAEAIS